MIVLLGKLLRWMLSCVYTLSAMAALFHGKTVGQSALVGGVR